MIPINRHIVSTHSIYTNELRSGDMTETTSASQQKRINEANERDRAQQDLASSTLVKRFKIKKRPVIFDLSGAGSTTNKTSRGVL